MPQATSAMMPDAISGTALDLRELALLLDVDGTIVDLAPTPGEVSAPPALRQTLARLFERTQGALAFVSGRPIGELDLIFAPLRLPAIGGHGVECRTVAGAGFEARGRHPLSPGVKHKFAAIAEGRPGVIVEDKGYSLALHYRLAPEQGPAVLDAAAAVRSSLRSANYELLSGKSVVEIKQAGFNKGSAVRELMSIAPFAGRRPLFIGDDITDWDVFAALPEYGGIAISVGKPFPGVVHHFDAPADVRRWLEQTSQSGVLSIP